MDNHAHAEPRPGAPKTPLESCVAWFREQQRVLAAFAELQAAGMLEAEELLSEALKRVAAAVVHGAVPPHPEKLTPYCLRIIRSTARSGSEKTDTFQYTSRGELLNAVVDGLLYGYDFDNIGNRRMMQEGQDYATYLSNNLNQYTSVNGVRDGEEYSFSPTYDDAGNQASVKTSTGVWSVVYNAENRPVTFTQGNTVIECSYDYMGRRATKKVTVDGSVTLYQRFIYRGYLQIACCDLTRTAHPCLWLITWDPTQPIATRPLAIQKDGTWYTYG